MKVAFKNGRGEVKMGELPINSPAPDEVRIRVEACGVCGTDLHLSESSDMTPFGHEIAGEVIRVGAHVSHLAVGDKVAVESSSPCGICANCHDTRQESCSDIRSFFLTGNFGFQEETNVPAISAFKYTGMAPEIASLSEPLGVAIDMVRLAEISIESNVLLIGPGCIGLMALALCKRAGARRVFVAGTSRRPQRFAVAQKFGADAYIAADKTPLAEYDFDCKIDRVLVTAPPKTLNDVFAVATRGAIISFIGIEHGQGEFCCFDVNAFHFKKLQLRASFASPALYTPMALRFLQEGIVDGEALISHRYPLAQTAQALETARTSADAVKVIVQP